MVMELIISDFECMHMHVALELNHSHSFDLERHKAHEIFRALFLSCRLHMLDVWNPRSSSAVVCRCNVINFTSPQQYISTSIMSTLYRHVTREDGDDEIIETE